MSNDEAALIRKLSAAGYVIPPYCTLPIVGGHADGIGGCWGISSGQQPERGEEYCVKCEYYNGDAV